MSEPSIVEQNAEQVSNLAKAFSNPSRVRILQLVSSGNWRVKEIAEALGVTYAVASQQVTALRRLGAIEENREGLNSRYAIADRRIRLLLDAFAYIFDQDEKDG